MALLTKIIWSKHKFYELWMIQSQNSILWLWMGGLLLGVLGHLVGDLATWSEEAWPLTVLLSGCHLYTAVSEMRNYLSGSLRILQMLQVHIYSHIFSEKNSSHLPHKTWAINLLWPRIWGSHPWIPVAPRVYKQREMINQSMWVCGDFFSRKHRTLMVGKDL